MRNASTFWMTAIVVFILAAGCSPDSRPDCGPGESCCTQDLDCLEDEICRDSLCAKVECKRDGDCATDEHCQDNECRPDVGCTSDADCQEPLPLCDIPSGNCVACTPSCAGLCCGPDGCGGTCQDECASTGQNCDPEGCACEGVCEPECGGQQCGPDGCEGECGPGCGANERCEAGQCVPLGCLSDPDCAPPTPRCDIPNNTCVECIDAGDCLALEICSGNICADPPVCQADDECEIGQICVAGDCETGCRSTRDCPGDQQCLENQGPHGTCVDCVSDPDCAPGWICQDNACFEHCTDDIHCTPEHCDLVTNACVACLDDVHCGDDSGQICVGLQCIPGCRIDEDCAGGHCEPQSLQCVDCLNSDHCSLGTVCVGFECVAGCESERDCPGNLLCDPNIGAHGGCVECLGDPDCPVAHICQQGLCEFHCATDADCTPPNPACDLASGVCVACTGDQHCGIGTICVGTDCVPGCSTDGDCPPTQVCDPAIGQHGGCVACRTTADCPAGFSCQSSRCVLEGEEQVRIVAGTYLRGSDAGEGDADEEPEVMISLPTFYIDRTEVTNEQYRLCVQAGACTEPFEMIAYNDPAKNRHPVVYVAWSQALDYCQWKDMSLPTEARWERAARGAAPDERTYPWGNGIPDCSRANYSGCFGGTDLVGARPNGASPEGVLDLAGNVWEWVIDRYDSDYYEWGTTIDPLGPSSGTYRVVRGGAYDGLPEHIRCANRASRPPDQASPNVGFRCALVGAPTASFTVTPQQAPYDVTFQVDANGCSDPNHPIDSLEVRWDWEGDGTWDTTWSTAKVATHRYAVAGFYDLALEVRDPDGNSNTTSQQVIVEGTWGWEGDACAVDADCSSGFMCVANLLFGEYACRQFCIDVSWCDFPDRECTFGMTPDSLPMLACLPI